MDTFRKEYKPMSDETKVFIEKLKTQAELLEKMIDEAGTPNNMRLIALAKTNLEQAIMWAVKGITA